MDSLVEVVVPLVEWNGVLALVGEVEDEDLGESRLLGGTLSTVSLDLYGL